MNLFSGFKVEREVLVDPDHNHRPLALLRAADGGYFVLENSYGNGIVKVDSSGKMQWRYTEPDPGIYLKRPGTAVEFTTAAPAPDGGVLIGGHRGKAAEHGNDQVGGVLIRLDKDGHVVGRVDPALKQIGQEDILVDVYAVSRWGDDFAAIGTTSHEQVVLRLRNDGSVLWRKRLEMRGAAESQRAEARPMSNGDLIFYGLDSVVRLSANGKTLQEVDLDGSCVWVAFATPSDRIQFLCHTNDERLTTVPQLVEVDRVHEGSQVTELSHFRESVGTIGLSRPYGMPGGTYIFFGTTWGDLQRFIPTVVELGVNQSVVAKKEFIGLKEGVMTDGMPTGLPGEYVVIRPVLRDKACTAMTFLRRY